MFWTHPVAYPLSSPTRDTEQLPRSSNDNELESITHSSIVSSTAAARFCVKIYLTIMYYLPFPCALLLIYGTALLTLTP
jgi:hypothetical protein